MNSEMKINIREKLTGRITLTETVNAGVEAAYEQIRRKAAGGQNAGCAGPLDAAQDYDCGKRQKSRRLTGGAAPRKRRWPAVAAAAALCTAVIGVPVGVLAATGFFQKETKLESGTLTYHFSVNYDLQPGVFDVTPNYIPDGYAGDGMKYHSEDGWKKDFSLLPIWNTADLAREENSFTQYHVENVEHTTLSGMSADIVTFQDADKNESPTFIFLFNEAEGYVMEVWGDYGVSVDELTKIADNLTITRTGIDVSASEQGLTEDVEKTTADQDGQEWSVPPAADLNLSAEQIVPLGQSYTSSHWDGSVVTFTVLDAQISDTLGTVDTTCFVNYDELTPWLNADGSLRPYTRRQYSQDGLDVIAEETMEQRFLRVRVRAEMSCDEAAMQEALAHGCDPEDIGQIALDACVKRLGEEHDGIYEWFSDNYGPVPNEHYFLQRDSRCIYLDAPNPLPGGMFFYRDMQDGDCVEYDMIFVIDRDAADGRLVLDFNMLANYGNADAMYFAIE